MRYSVFDMNMLQQPENVGKWRFTLVSYVNIAMASARLEVLMSVLENT